MSILLHIQGGPPGPDAGRRLAAFIGQLRDAWPGSLLLVAGAFCPDEALTEGDAEWIRLPDPRSHWPEAASLGRTLLAQLAARYDCRACLCLDPERPGQGEGVPGRAGARVPELALRLDQLVAQGPLAASVDTWLARHHPLELVVEQTKAVAEALSWLRGRVDASRASAVRIFWAGPVTSGTHTLARGLPGLAPGRPEIWLHTAHLLSAPRPSGRRRVRDLLGATTLSEVAGAVALAVRHPGVGFVLVSDSQHPHAPEALGLANKALRSLQRAAHAFVPARSP